MEIIDYVYVVIHIIDILTRMKPCTPVVANTVIVMYLCRVKKMKNPCRTCLIKSCCTDVCGQKSMYSNIILMDLDKVAKHIYSNNGLRKKYIPQNISKEFDKTVAICEENRQERDRIMNRHIDRFFV